MDSRHIQTFRLFQRTITREIGVLQDDFLSRGRPLGASRMLWEMGEGPVEVASLRERLDLDPAYASRLLGMLADEGLVVIEPSPSDARAKVVRRTPAGEAEQAAIDIVSDEAAASLLEGLAPAEHEEVDRAARLLTRTVARKSIAIAVEPPQSADAVWCRDQYFAEIDAIFDSGYEPAASIQATDDDLTPPRGALLLARYHGQPVGCGAVKLPPGEPAHLKRMWVAPSARGMGVADALLDRLENLARASGATVARLDTNSALVAATRLYRSRGYVEVPDFNGETHADLWFTKEL